MFVQGLARVVIQRVEVDQVKLAVTALAVQRVFTAGPSLAAPVSVQLDYLTQGAISQSVSQSVILRPPCTPQPEVPQSERRCLGRGNELGNFYPCSPAYS